MFEIKSQFVNCKHFIITEQFSSWNRLLTKPTFANSYNIIVLTSELAPVLAALATLAKWKHLQILPSIQI